MEKPSAPDRHPEQSSGGWLRKAAPFLGLSLFILALIFLGIQARKFSLDEVISHIRELTQIQLTLAILFTFISYLALSGYDYLAIRFLRVRLSYWRTALAAFIGAAFGNAVGLAILTGASVRVRLYASWGLKLKEISKIVLFCSLSFWMGFLLLCGFLFSDVHYSSALSRSIYSQWGIKIFGVGCLGLVGTYLVLSYLRRKPFNVFGFQVPFPPFNLSLSQVCLATFDWMATAAVFYFLLPLQSEPVSYLLVLTVFLMAQLLSLVSHVPAGLGVFDSVVLLFLSHKFSAPQLVSALLLFRLIYYFAPFVLAAFSLGSIEYMEHRSRRRIKTASRR